MAEALYSPSSDMFNRNNSYFDLFRGCWDELISRLHPGMPIESYRELPFFGSSCSLNGGWSIHSMFGLYSVASQILSPCLLQTSNTGYMQ